MSVDLEKTATEQAGPVAKALVETARRGGTEADFRRDAARILEDAGLFAGLTRRRRSCGDCPTAN